MFIRIVCLIMALLPLSALCQAKINGLGSNYEVYDFGGYSPDRPWYEDWSHPTIPPNNNWYVPAHEYKHPVYLYQLNPNLVKSQMQNMRNSGIDVLVLRITTADLATCEANGGCPTPYNDGIWGWLTDVSQSALRPQQQQNLKDILRYATTIGFRKVILRFGYTDVGKWTSWNEVGYQKQWNLIFNTHNLATSILDYTATRLITDLGGEAIGIPCPSNNQTCQYKPYVQRLWADYTLRFGNSDTIGF